MEGGKRPQNWSTLLHADYQRGTRSEKEDILRDCLFLPPPPYPETLPPAFVHPSLWVLVPVGSGFVFLHLYSLVQACGVGGQRSGSEALWLMSNPGPQVNRPPQTSSQEKDMCRTAITVI